MASILEFMRRHVYSPINVKPNNLASGFALHEAGKMVTANLSR